MNTFKLLLLLTYLTISAQAIELDIQLNYKTPYSIIDYVKQEEGFRPYIYKDNGHKSIGYGTNLSYGITKAEAELLLVHRLSIIEAKLTKYKWFIKLTHNRKLVIINMTYQLGMNGMLQFKHMIWRIQQNYYKAAANAMLDSTWAKQTPNRAKRLYWLMIQG
jgi:lysozyme